MQYDKQSVIHFVYVHPLRRRTTYLVSRSKQAKQSEAVKVRRGGENLYTHQMCNTVYWNIDTKSLNIEPVNKTFTACSG